ncbi:Protein FAM122A [Merluccius polli]|uniref:Protein FAM122A n=1 Tax=Merluccius polli TaxID=89951 RepID=A0AA47NTD7_MERPO|nr:Protein FAM122A [Merluccius polli]
MERMEVDQCAGAAGAAGGGALRRSNSAPMITSVSSDGMTVFGPFSSARYRRSSVSVNPSCPSRPVPLSPFSLTNERLEHKTQEENMEMALRGSLRRLSSSSLMPLPSSSQWHHHTPAGFHAGQDGGVTPNSSPSPTRRFRPVMSSTVTRPTLTPLKRKGGVEFDGPPKKLFVAGVTDPTHHNNFTVSVSQAVVGSPTGGGVMLCSSPQDSPLSLSPPPSFSPHHPRH